MNARIDFVGVRCWHLTVEPRVQTRFTSFRIPSARSDSGAVEFLRFAPANHHSAIFVRHFTMLPLVDYLASNERIIDELERISKEAVVT
jgi:hypothetical protein